MLELGNTPRNTDLDGSILWVINEYKHEDWFHTLTKLNKYCFLIYEETQYLDYLEPVARTYGAYCSNLSDFISYYEGQEWVIHKKYECKDKSVFKLTESGEEKLCELVIEGQSAELKSGLEDWDKMSVLNLVDEVYSQYPEYSL